MSARRTPTVQGQTWDKFARSTTGTHCQMAQYLQKDMVASTGKLKFAQDQISLQRTTTMKTQAGLITSSTLALLPNPEQKLSLLSVAPFSLF